MYTRFQTKTAPKPLPDGAAHTNMAYIREYPPPARSNSQLFLSLIAFLPPGFARPCLHEGGGPRVGEVTRLFIYSYFEKGCQKKMNATIPKGIVGCFEYTILQRNLKE